jgi:hypothetical protein
MFNSLINLNDSDTGGNISQLSAIDIRQVLFK